MNLNRVFTAMVFVSSFFLFVSCENSLRFFDSDTVEDSGDEGVTETDAVLITAKGQTAEVPDLLNTSGLIFNDESQMSFAAATYLSRAQYSFDNNLLDSSGNNYHAAVASGQAVYDQGAYGSSLYFNNSWLTVPDSSEFNFERTDVLCFDVWVKRTYLKDEENIVSRMEHADGNPESKDMKGWKLYFEDNGKVTFILRHSWDSNNHKNLLMAQTIKRFGKKNRWYHIELFYDGSSSVSGVQIKVDGEFQSINAIHNNLSGSIMSENAPLLIGGPNNLSSSFTGYIDELEINMDCHSNPCDGVVCGTNSHCETIEGSSACICDPGYTEEIDDGTCINEKQVDCTDVAPENGTSTIVPVTVTYTDENGWTTPAECEWTCNEGFENIEGQCVPENNVCDGITCSGHGTCTDQNGIPVCICDSDYTNDGDVLQCINSKQVNCTENTPANATSIVAPVTIIYTTANGWSTPANCAWNCNTDYFLENGVCINSKQVNCTDNAPSNATSDIVPVTITYTTANGWTIPADCNWNCNTDYFAESGSCINSKQVNCTDAAPSNATSSITPVTITYTTANGWSTPANCVWNCNTNYISEDGSTCINSKQVNCIDNAPANATSVVVPVTIIYTTAGGWTAPGNCAWNCNTDYISEDSATCINSKEVNCTDESPSNAASVIAPVTITYTTAGGWTIPSNCAWNCNTNYISEDGQSCINSKIVDCIPDPFAPDNSGDEIAPVTINYTSADGWETVPYCSWTCLVDHIYDNGSCINSKQVNCTDNAPANAASDITQVTITYTTIGGWTTPSGCNWNCNTDYVSEDGQTCINSKQAVCTDNAPVNATSAIASVTIIYTTANGWSVPADCSWNCNADYFTENGNCINSKLVNCTDIAPSNATSDIVSVTVTYTTAGGWTAPANCFWTCNTDYVSEDGQSCINSKQVSCIENSPENAASVIVPVTITYTTANGWTSPSDCSWNCIAGYHKESSVCVINECELGNSQSEICGLNNRGTKTRSCQNYYWGAWSLCSDPDVCIDGSTRICGNDCFAGNEECITGQWGICDVAPVPVNYGQSCEAGIGACHSTGTIQCDTQCSAVPGNPADEICDNIDNDCDGSTDEDLIETVNCGLNNRGVRERMCSGGIWSPLGECIDPDVCIDNTKETGVCLVNGTHSRTCVTGQWAEWTKCICNADYHLNETGTECESDTKIVECIVNIPENAVVTETHVTINWVNNAWQPTPECGWICIDGFDKIGPVCVISLPDPCLNYSCGDHGSCVASDVSFTQIGTIEDDWAEGIVSYGSYSLFVGNTRGQFNPDVPEGIHGFSGLSYSSGGYDINQNKLSGDIIYTDIFSSPDGINYISATQYYGIISTTGVMAVDDTGTILREIPFDLDEQIDELAVLPDGNICFAGQTVKSIFPKNMSGLLLDKSLGAENIFVGCADSNGNVLWGTLIGTIRTEVISNIVVDAVGNLHIVGSTSGSFFEQNLGEHDVFYMVFSKDGELISGAQFGSSRYDMASDILLVDDTVFISASTMGSWGRANIGEMDAVLISFNTVSQQVNWVKQYGTPDNDYASSVVLAYDEYIQVVGHTQGIMEAGRIIDYDVKGKKTFDIHATAFLQNGTLIKTDQIGDNGYHFRPRDTDSMYGLSSIIAEKGPVIEDVTLDIRYRDLAHFQMETFGRPFFPQCVCDEGYIFRNGECIERVGCDLIDCGGHGSCVESNGVFFCDCNYGYVWPDGDMTQCINTRVEPCIDPEEPYSTTIPSVHSVTYLPKTDSWSKPPKCSFTCNSGYKMIYINKDPLCVPVMMEECVVYHTMPEHSTYVLKDVEVSYNPQTGQMNHPICSWTCNEGFWPSLSQILGGGPATCGERAENCKPLQKIPYGAKNVSRNHIIPYNWTYHEWEETPSCEWKCMDDYIYDEDLGHCTHDREVDCRIINVPENAHANIEPVKIYYSSALNKWQDPVICTWNCDEGFVLSEYGNGCVPTDQCFYEERARFAEPVISRPTDFIIILDNSFSMDFFSPYHPYNLKKLGEYIAEKSPDYRVVMLSISRELPIDTYVSEYGMPVPLAEGFNNSIYQWSLGGCLYSPLTPDKCEDSSRAIQPDYNYGGNYSNIGIGVGSWNSFRVVLDHYDAYSYFLRSHAYLQFVEITDDNSDMPWSEFRRKFEAKAGKEFVFHGVFATVDDYGKASALGLEYSYGVVETGGFGTSIGNPAWADKFDFIPDETIKKTKRDIALTAIPQPGTIKLFYHNQGGSRKLPYIGEWTYNGNSNSVRIQSRDGIEIYDDFTIQYLIADGSDVYCGDGLGECRKGRTKTCFAGVWTNCSEIDNYDPENFLPSEDLCDGLDNNCNGFIDDTCVCEPGEYYECGMEDAEWSVRGSAYCEDGFKLGQCVCPYGYAWRNHACINKMEIDCFMVIPMNSEPLFGDGKATMDYNPVLGKWESTCDFKCKDGFTKKNNLCYSPNGFVDPNMERCVEEHLNGDWSQIESLEVLDCRQKGIIRFEGIEQLINLRTADFSYNFLAYSFMSEIMENVGIDGVFEGYENIGGIVFAPLQYLSMLETLIITNNNSYSARISLAPLLAVTSLQHLDLSEMSVENPDLFLQMIWLRRLEFAQLKDNFHYRKLSSLNGINNIVNLEHLNLKGNGITNINMLRYNREIRFLNVASNGISDGGQLHYLPYLNELHIYDNPLRETCGDELDNNWNGLVDDGCCEPGDRMVCATECGEGYRECNNERNWEQCSSRRPTNEICDGIDNDCDGEIDEGILPRSCQNICGTGVEHCLNGVWQGCNAPWPSMEICDGMDNDCDGIVDEGCECMNGETTECGISTGECKTGAKLCIGGHWSECSGDTGPSPEVCDGLDNNCDGNVDENCPCDESIPVPCGTEGGNCTSGFMKCVEGILTVCEGAVHPEPEICDGIDNDCDGSIDEGLTLKCDTPCGFGHKVCSNGSWSECVAPNAQTEICDNRDNDCDGVVDNNVKNTRVCGINLKGLETQICSKGVWGEWGECVDPDVCISSETESRSCGGSGTQSKMCFAGQWSRWSNCLCPADTHLELGMCISNTRFADCRTPAHPVNAHPVVAVVENLWVSGAWSPVEYCAWECNAGYNYLDGQCVGGCETYNCGDNGYCDEHGVAYRNILLNNSDVINLDVLNYIPGQGLRMYGKATGEFPGYPFEYGNFKIRISNGLEIQEVANTSNSEWIIDEAVGEERIYTYKMTQTGTVFGWKNRYNPADTGEISVPSGGSGHIEVDEAAGSAYIISGVPDGTRNNAVYAYSLVTGAPLWMFTMQESYWVRIEKTAYRDGKIYMLAREENTDGSELLRVLDVSTQLMTTVSISPDVPDTAFHGDSIAVDDTGRIYIAGQFNYYSEPGPFPGYPMVQAMVIRLTPEYSVDWSYSVNTAGTISAYTDVIIRNNTLYLLGAYMGLPSVDMRNITDQPFAGETWLILTTLSMEPGSQPVSWLYGDDRCGSILGGGDNSPASKKGLDLRLVVENNDVFAVGVVDYYSSMSLMVLKISSFDSPQCRCETGYASYDGVCINSRMTSCYGYVPRNSTPVQQSVEIVIMPDGRWETPVCLWNCNEGYYEYEGACINGKHTQCDSSATPSNATPYDNKMWVEYYGNGNWGQVAACDWTCNEGFIRSGNGCAEIFADCDTAVCGMNSTCVTSQRITGEQMSSIWIDIYIYESKMIFTPDGSGIIAPFHSYQKTTLDPMPGEASQYVYFGKFNVSDLSLAQMVRDDINFQPSCVTDGSCSFYFNNLRTSVTPDGSSFGYRNLSVYQNVYSQSYGWKDDMVTFENDGTPDPVRKTLVDRMDFTSYNTPNPGYFGMLTGSDVLAGNTENPYLYPLSTSWLTRTGDQWNTAVTGLPYIDSYSNPVYYDETSGKLLWVSLMWGSSVSGMLNTYDKNTSFSGHLTFFQTRENEYLNYSKIIKSTDGTVYIAGTTSDNPADNEPYGNQICILHALNSDHSLRWTKYLYQQGGTYCNVDMLKASANGVYIVTKQQDQSYMQKTVLNEFNSAGDRIIDVSLNYQGSVKDIFVSGNLFKILGTYGNSIEVITGEISIYSACQCDSGYILEKDSCVNTKTVPCDSSRTWEKPRNSYFVTTYHDLYLNPDGNWPQTPICQWTCNEGHIFDWSTDSCVFVPEECNGIDDNGNGLIDENLVRACDGLCEIGYETCVEGAWSGCATREPSAELCDGVDNNCDGRIDEGLTKNCSNECGFGSVVCANGTWSVCSAPAVPSNYGAPCFAGVGMCASFGTIGCDGVCSAVPGRPYEEICNGVDDDCNGLTDDNCIEDNEWPVAIIHHGRDFSVETKLDIVITATDDHIEFWELSMAPAGSGEYVAIAGGYDSVVESPVFTVDAANIANGIYDIMLTVQDIKGHVNERGPVTMTIDSKLKIGQYSFALNDMTLPVSGIPITVTRAYNSFNKKKGDFGVGWDMVLGSGVKIQSTRPLGDGWYMYTDEECIYVGFGYYIPCYKLENADRPSRVFVTWPDGNQERFEMQVEFVDSLSPSAGVKYWFVPLEGTTSTLVANAPNPSLFAGGMMMTSTGGLFDADLFTLTTKEGVSYQVSKTSGVKHITDTNGNRLVLELNAIRHMQKDSSGNFRASGMKIGFERDSSGRVVKVVDDTNPSDIRQALYGYNSKGDLTSFTDQTGKMWLYAYDDNHNLVSIIDPRGIEIMQMGYDDQGRFIGMADGYGNVTSVEHDTDNVREIITEPFGHQKIYEYNEKGYVTTEYFKESGGVEVLVRSWTYDSRGNELTETVYDESGNGFTTYRDYDKKDNKVYELLPGAEFPKRWVYDARSNLIEEQSAAGLITRYCYDSGNNLIKTVYPDETGITAQCSDTTGIFSRNIYNQYGLLTEMRDAGGNTQTFGYDSFGNMKSMTDANGHTVNYTYDTRGNKLTQYETVTTVNGTETVTTGYQYDSKNRVVKTTYPDGRFSTTEYNAIDKRSATVDADGRRTEFEYDLNGNLVLTRYHDGTTETSSYDSKNRRISSIDREGIETSYEYDSRDNQVKVIRYFGTPQESLTQTIYNHEGRVVAEIDAMGNMTEYGYFNDGSRKLVRNALGEETHYTYDHDGQMDTMTSPAGTTFKYYYDNRGRQVESTWVGKDEFGSMVENTIETTEYDNAGRMIAKTDANGNTTHFAYDPGGRLLTVTDALTNVTSYTYDERGQKLTQTDANDHTTTWGYDKFGRQVIRTLPMGQIETFAYNTDGTLASKTDFNGNTAVYAYDPVYKRLASVSYTDGTSESYTYEPVSGRRLTATNSNGTTTYEYYPVTNRLLKVTNPDSSWISYEYDNNDNRTAVVTVSGRTDYTFDALGRISTVREDGAITGTDYTYSIHGGLHTTTYKNGTVSENTFDSLGRLTYIENRKADNSIISSFSYTLDAIGNRTHVIENAGRSVTYIYDELNRLTSEAVNELGVIVFEAVYTYDPTGNRLTKTDGEGITSYVYDSNDRLVTETAPAVTWTYAYDANGNTLSRTDGTVTVAYSYDANNRLVEADTGTDLVLYGYNTDGIRTQKSVNGAEINYLIDSNRQYAQVLEEKDGTGTVLAEYVYGNDLISQVKSGEKSYYHYDGHGSTSSLTSETGTQTGSYRYEAFGRILENIGTAQTSYLYSGEQYDTETDQYYLRSRYYNPEAGRFHTMDTWQGMPFEPLTLNKYLYADANPIMMIDPSGNWSIMEMMTAIYVRTTIAMSSMPIVTGAIGITVGLLIPEEVYNNMATIPYFNNIGALGSGSVRTFKLLKNKRLLNFIKTHNDELWGLLNNKLGHNFENVLLKYVFKGATPQITTVGKNSADFLWKEFVIEVKSGGWTKNESSMKQLKAMVAFANEKGIKPIYVFLKKPSKSAIETIEKEGAKVSYFFE